MNPRRDLSATVPALLTTLLLVAGVGALPARTTLLAYPTDLYVEARGQSLEGRLDQAEELWRRMLRQVDTDSLYAVDLATACGEESTTELLDRLRQVHPVYSLSEPGAGCRRILFGLFPTEEGMEPLVRALPAVSLYPPTIVRIDRGSEGAPVLREVRRLSTRPQAPLPPASGEGPDTAAGESPGDERTAPPAQAEARDLFEEGKEALLRQDLETAEDRFRAVLAREPRNVSALHNLGIVRIYREDFSEGISLFERVLEEDPSYLKAYLNLATAYFGQGRGEEALETLEQAAGMAPDAFEVRYALAALSAETGDIERAHAELRRALDLKPEDPRARALAQALPPEGTAEAKEEHRMDRADGGTGTEQDSEAATATLPDPTFRPRATRPGSTAGDGGVGTSEPARRARLREPTVGPGQGMGSGAETGEEPETPVRRPVNREAQAAFQAATRAYDDGDLRRAEREFVRAAGLDPANPNIHNNLGAVYLDQGRWSDAVEAFRRALSADPEHLKARINLGAALYNQGRPEEALQILREAEAMDPAHAEVLYALALLETHRGRRVQARALVARALESDPFNSKIRALEDALASSEEQLYVGEPEIFLRGRPDRNASVLGKLRYGAALQVLQRRPGWVRVRVTADGMEGWVSAGLLTARAPAS